MLTFEPLDQLIARLLGYLRNEPFVVLLELLIFWVLVFVVFRFLRGTRGARAIKGVVVLLIATTLVIKVLGSEGVFERLNFVYQNFLGYASLAMVIVFQPELRRALVRIGEARLFRTAGLQRARVIEEVISSVAYLSRNKIGGLIVMEREVGMEGVVEAGTKLDAVVSQELLNTVFWPGSALHDMAVIIRGERIVAAGVQLPLAEAEQFSSELGSRHRAAIGLSQESDAMVIVVSEETGTISLAERGRLIRNLSLDGLRTALVRGLGEVAAGIPNGDNDKAA
ncbi:MAG: TIGR00159 family protein [Phycisphaeraceae bacterium]|nr:TIGR00159 family protein [Phycisphaeraceae bacterium]